MSDVDKDVTAGSTAEALQPWERNRKLREAELAAANEHGEQLVSRYCRDVPRPRFAAVGHAPAKRKRRR